MVLLAQQPDASTLAAAMFYLFAAGAAASALMVVISRNIVRMAVALMFTLTSVAGLYFTLNAEFLAAVQLVVYAGGTLILIVFGVMLTSKSPFSRFAPRAGEVAAAIAIGGLLLVGLLYGINSIPRGTGRPLETGDAYPLQQLGQALLGDYLIPFELASVLLLVVMIGAAYLAKGRRREHESRET